MYHALNDLKVQKYKWLNLRKLSELLISRQTQRIVKVCFFTASPDHFQNTPAVDKLLRHRAYKAALESKGVQCIEGSFAERTRTYKDGSRFRATWVGHEEKQTDVAIAVQLVHDAYQDVYDRALVVCVDTDQLPAYKLIRSHFPAKKVICVAPPKRQHLAEIIAATTGTARIKMSQLDKCLFGREVRKDGRVVAKRPLPYRP